MNKFVIIGIVALIILAGAGYFVMSKRNSNSSSTETTTEGSTAQKGDTPKTLEDLMKGYTNQTCTFSDADSKSSGTVYVGEGKMRADFTSVTDGAPTTGHMLSDSQNVYVWVDGETGGYKVPYSTVATAGSGVGANSPIDLSNESDYSCSAWSPDTTKFDVPNMEFMDLSSLMATPAPTSQSSATDPGKCSACDSVPESAKAQCLAALGC